MSELVPLSRIQVGERFRQELGDIDGLAESIRAYGLLQPIVIDRDYNLVAGGRRTAAAKQLGLTEILATFRDELDAVSAREIELEENIRRKDLTWVERAQLVAEIDRLKREKYGNATSARDDQGATGWSLRDTAEATDRSLAMVSYDVAAARLIEVMPELKEEGSVTDAIKRADATLEALRREQELRKNRHKAEAEIQLGDCRELIKAVADASIDCVIIDPPYGTEAQGNIHFDDRPLPALELLAVMLPKIKRVMKPNAHLYCFFGIKLWTETFDLFRRTFGDSIDPVPLVWIKNTTGLVDFSKRYAHSWEPILFVSSGERSLSKMRNNVFQYDAPQDRDNTAEKPEGLIAELICQSTVEGETILDTFSGSGVVACEATRLKRRFVAFEKERDQWTRSCLRLSRLEMENSTSYCGPTSTEDTE